MPEESDAQTGHCRDDTDRLRPQCFNPDCDESFESVDEMVAVPGRGGRSPRHFCESCAERIRRGPPMTDGGSDMDGMEREAVTEIVSNGGRDSDGSPRMLSRWTFQYTPARKFVEKRLKGRVLNACAGRTKLNHDGEIVRNDLNPDADADTHHDVVEIADHFEPRSFDTIVFDPPFDEKQAESKYDGLHAMDVYAALEAFEELVRPGGIVICLGWNSWGMRSFGAFERTETTLFQRGPIHRDVIATVDRRTSYSLATDGGNACNVGTDTDRTEVTDS